MISNSGLLFLGHPVFNTNYSLAAMGKS